MDGQLLIGKAVFYDPSEPFQGHINDGRIAATLQPNGRFSQAFEYRNVAFDRESTGERLYDLDIPYSRTTFQFSRQFFIRGSSSSIARDIACSRTSLHRTNCGQEPLSTWDTGR
jgi:hypothetical protein